MHEIWHITVLVVTLFAAAALAVGLLAPLVFDSTPPGVKKARPATAVLVTLAVVLLVIEWLQVH